MTPTSRSGSPASRYPRPARQSWSCPGSSWPRPRRPRRPGRTEREAAADIASAIAAQGHARIDFVIVGSGPNAAKPHHEPSDRVLSHGDAVVVDIGGTMPSGYCSDCTRTYAIGEVPPG